MPHYLLPSDNTLLFKEGQRPVYFKDVVNPFNTTISLSSYIDNPLSTEKYGAIFCGQMVLGEHGRLMKKKVNTDVVKKALRTWFDNNIKDNLNAGKSTVDNCFYHWAFVLLEDSISGWDRENWMRVYNMEASI